MYIFFRKNSCEDYPNKKIQFFTNYTSSGYQERTLFPMIVGRDFSDFIIIIND